MKNWTNFLFFFLCLSCIDGQTLVMDMDTTTESSTPEGIKAGINGFVFLAKDPIYGLELFRSDGTEANTKIFMDHIPGPKDVLLWDYEVFDNHVYYALDKEKVIEIRKGDIQTGASILICKIDTRIEYDTNNKDIFLLHFRKSGDFIFFLFVNELRKLELWCIDIKQNNAKVLHTFPTWEIGQMMAVTPEHLFLLTKKYNADTSHLWCVNQQLALSHTGEILGWGDSEKIATLGNSMYFTAFDAGDKKSRQRILWSSDGKPAGTKPVLCPIDNGKIMGVEFLNTFKEELYFLDFHEERRRSLWKLNSKSPIPQIVLTSKKDVETIAFGKNFNVTNNYLYFEKYFVATKSYSLCRTNGEPGHFETMAAFAENKNPSNYLPTGNTLYLSLQGHELWKLGDQDSTPVLLTILPDSLGFSFASSVTMGKAGKIFSPLNSKGETSHFLFSDGSPERTKIIWTAQHRDYHYQQCILFWKNQLYFAINDLWHGTELWFYDPTKNKLSLLKDINTINASARPRALTLYKGGIYCAIADRNESSSERSKYVYIDLKHSPILKETNISTIERMQLIDVIKPDSLLILDKKILVSGINFRRLFSDLTNITYEGRIQDKLLMRAYSEKQGFELWVTDERFESIQLLKEIGPGRIGGFMEGRIFKLADTLICFVGGKNSSDKVMWRTNGQSQGTYPLDQNRARSLDFIIDSIYTLLRPQGKLFSNLSNIVKSNDKIGPGADYGPLLSNGQYLFFDLSQKGRQLWRTDGTPEGTIFLAYISPNVYKTWALTELFNVGPFVYFIAANHLGIELWQTDGTPQNTKIVFDLNPGPAHGSPDELIVHNGEVYFSGNDGVHGNELFKFTPQGNTTESCPIKVSGGGNNSWSLQISRPSFIPSKARIELWTSNGELKPLKFTFAAGKAVLDLKKFEPGTYWLYIVEGTKTWIKAIVKPKG